MRVNRFSSPVDSTVSEPATSELDRWRARLQQLRAAVRRLTPFASGVAAALVAILLYQALNPPPHQITAREVNDSVVKAIASVTPLPPFSERVYEVIRPSLVLIQSDSPGADGKVEHSVGSGVIVNDAGDILTSLHVVTQATDIQVTFADGTESRAHVTASQPENDIAVLRVSNPPKQIIPAILGNPNAERVGDEAFVVGNPFGLYGSMSAGVISGFDRSFQPQNSEHKLQGLIQIDAAVNPGNSGGPLLNRHGEVIGIVTGLVNPTEQNFFVGVGFAVPITTAGTAVGAPPW